MATDVRRFDTASHPGWAEDHVNKPDIQHVSLHTVYALHTLFAPAKFTKNAQTARID